LAVFFPNIIVIRWGINGIIAIVKVTFFKHFDLAFR